MSHPDDLATLIRRELRAAADPTRAPGMQAYMKSTMPYLGVPLPSVRKIALGAARAVPPADLASLIGTVYDLWRTADHREERYAAIDLTGLKLATGRLDMLPVYREIIVTGAWWDLVDPISTRIGELLLEQRPVLEPELRTWSTDPDRWLRRSSIISQLALKDRTDVNLLTDVIEVNLADREFFIRKAIGWALRQYARTDPDWVRGFVRDHESALSPLSRREAMKHLR